MEPEWTVFTVEPKEGETYALKTAHGRYVTADGDRKLKGEYTGASTWESFTRECISGICIFHEN